MYRAFLCAVCLVLAGKLSSPEIWERLELLCSRRSLVVREELYMAGNSRFVTANISGH